ncbi:MAG: right-handed parallel beta-helix repeat-containing protein, partial [Verrucomicrobiota bacterium]
MKLTFILFLFVSLLYAEPSQDISYVTAPVRDITADSTIGEMSLSIVPSFESSSLYVQYKNSFPANGCLVEYRKKGEATWSKGFPLYHEPKAKTFRGSLLSLNENTEYEVKLLLTKEDNEPFGTLQETFKTWTSSPPISQTIPVKELKKEASTLLIADQKNTSQAWVKIQGSGEVFDGGTTEEASITIQNCSYLILENIKVTGGKRYGIHLINCDNVRIINCDIGNFGRAGVQDPKKEGKIFEPGEKEYINYDPGIYIDQCSNTVVERCFIHDARGTANSWEFSHPAGPEAIVVR